MFEALIGDYSTLPRRYLYADYARDMSGWEIDGIVWHEFMAADPVREVEWAERLAASVPTPMAIVGLVDFLAPDLHARLDAMRGARMWRRSASTWAGTSATRCGGLHSAAIC